MESPIGGNGRGRRGREDRCGTRSSAAGRCRPSAGRLRGCRACPLWLTGTQTVSVRGTRSQRSSSSASSQATERTSRVGPFVGPAGKLLDGALVEAGIDRRRAYVTNVVKHFKWTARGKRRIHQKPNAAEISACRPWLDAELAVLAPRVLVCLGATAAQALLGRGFRVTRQRGQLVDSPLAPHALGTIHPSSILRAPDEAARQAELAAFVDDLRVVARLLAGGPGRYEG